MPDSAVEFRKERSAPKGPVRLLTEPQAVAAALPQRKPLTSQSAAQVHYPFWFGGSASCFAACVTHPLDLIKVRLQTQHNGGPKRSMVQMGTHIVTSEGVSGLYRGLTAALLRQATYSTTRFGVYETLKDHFAKPSGDSKPGVGTLVLLSSISGVLGGIAGNPADVLNVRMQHDAALPVAERRNYKHAIDGLIRMTREEGLVSLWRGVVPNSTRGLFMTASQLASYDVFKRFLLETKSLGMKDDLTTHFSASFLAGFVATTVCSPIDVIKTRVMSAKSRSSLPDLVISLFREEGLRWCFKGWVPSFIRLGPQTIVTFIFLEQHKKLYRSYLGVAEQ